MTTNLVSHVRSNVIGYPALHRDGRRELRGHGAPEEHRRHRADQLQAACEAPEATTVDLTCTRPGNQPVGVADRKLSALQVGDLWID